MAIPIFFTPPVLAHATYFGDPGLFINNYPIWIFNDLQQLVTGKFARSHGVCPTTLGIKIRSSDEGQAQSMPIEGLGDYVYALFKTMGSASDAMETSPEIERQSISVSCDLNPLVVPSSTDMTEMINQGLHAARLYFSRE
jgi:hypothetical protein